MNKSYRSKSTAKLLYICKDAGEAAVAMRGLDATAECKYLDQVNDACTELYRRRNQEERLNTTVRSALKIRDGVEI